MKSKILLSLFAVFAFSAAILAKDVLRSQAEKVAVNFFFEKTDTFGHEINYLDINITESYKVGNAYYVINFDDGWVVVSANDVTTPVLGYNVTGSYPNENDQSDNFLSWMQHYADQMEYIKENNIIASNEVSSDWNKYMTNNSKSLLNGNRDVITPLLTNTWNQDSPYNLLCPEDDAGPGGHVYVGCVATAMSMIMHYWRYPNSGSGSHSYYYYPYGTINANFGAANYEWDGMCDQLIYNNPWEIAEIGFHAAVSINMMFSPDGSGAYSSDVPFALKNYFNYSPQTQHLTKYNYSTSVWEGYLQDELDNGHPLYYSGRSSSGGHAFVCDAYEGMNYYHFNFGWSGSGNGFFTLQEVGGFNTDQTMIRNITPNDPSYPYIATGETLLTFQSGSFTDGSGPVEDYPSGMNVSWLISPQTEMDSIESLKLSFIEFDTDANDVLKVYDGTNADGTLIGEFSGGTIPSQINHDGNELFITFNSTASGKGFKLEYTSTSPVWCSGAQTFTEPTGSFSDGSDVFYYDNGATCVYIIQNSEAVNITLEFTEFSTEENKDKVKVYNAANQLIGEFSGHDIPDPISEETNTMYITWTSNNTIRDLGWSADYYIDGVGIEENIGNYENVLVYPNPSSGILNINFDVEKAGRLEVRLVNLNGQLIREEIINNFNGQFNHSFDLNSEARGVYILSILSEKGKIDKKIVLR